MLEKLEKDGLFFQKAGLILGTIGGLVLGLVISDKADRYQLLLVEQVKEEEVSLDGPEKI